MKSTTFTISPSPLPILGTTAQVLLMCAREHLNPRQAERIVELCGEVKDWPAFLQQAEYRLVLPLVSRHLYGLRPKGVPDEVIEALQLRSQRIVIQNLAMTATLCRLSSDVFAPLGVPHVFTKGATLAYRYYDDPGLRMARDIDVVVPRHAFEQVGRSMRASGYRLCESQHSEECTDDYLRFLTRYGGETSWRSPDGLLVEIEDGLRVKRGRLATSAILAAPEAISIGGVTIPVLQELNLLTYVCQHHSRHLWARLHWIADLDAILRRIDGGVNAFVAHARAEGLGGVVEASLALHFAASEPEPWRAELASPFAREMFRGFLTALEGDFSTEQRIRVAFRARHIDVDPDRIPPWIAKFRDLMANYRPTNDDFQQLRLPPRLYFLYWLVRPILVLLRRIDRFRSAAIKAATLESRPD